MVTAKEAGATAAECHFLCLDVQYDIQVPTYLNTYRFVELEEIDV